MENGEGIDYYQKPAAHAASRPTMDEEEARAKGKAGHPTAEPEPETSQEEFFSDSESIEIADLKKRMWKDQLLLMKLEGRSGRDRGPHPGDGHHQQHQQPAQDQMLASASSKDKEESPENRYRRKAMLRAQDGAIRHMLKMMEACNARGFVYGVVGEDGVPVSGSSDSLRGWWKDDVGFDRAGPLALLAGHQEPGSPMAASTTSRTARWGRWLAAVGAHPALRAPAAELPAGPGPGAAVVADGAGALVGHAGRGAGAPGSAAVPEAARPQESLEDLAAQRGDQAPVPALRPDAQARVAVPAAAAQDERQGRRDVVQGHRAGGGARPPRAALPADHADRGGGRRGARRRRRRFPACGGARRQAQAPGRTRGRRQGRWRRRRPRQGVAGAAGHRLCLRCRPQLDRRAHEALLPMPAGARRRRRARGEGRGGGRRGRRRRAEAARRRRGRRGRAADGAPRRHAPPWSPAARRRRAGARRRRAPPQPAGSR